MHPIKEELRYWKQEAMQRHREKVRLEEQCERDTLELERQVKTLRSALTKLLKAYRKLDDKRVKAKAYYPGIAVKPANLNHYEELL